MPIENNDNGDNDLEDAIERHIGEREHTGWACFGPEDRAKIESTENVRTDGGHTVADTFSELQAEADATGREPIALRQHSTYEQDNWETAHVERVDRIGAFESAPIGVSDDETIRVDLDGYGHPGASMHDPDNNLQVSFWLTPETAAELADDLEGELDREGVVR